MTTEQLDQLFTYHNYHKVVSNLPEFYFFFCQENYGISVIHVVDYHEGLYLTKDQFSFFRNKISEFFQEKGASEVHVLSLIICDDIQKASNLLEGDSFCWIIDKVNDELIVPETSVSDFYGFRTVLARFFEDPSAKGNMVTYEEDEDVFPRDTEKSKHVYYRSMYFPWVSLILVATNVILFIICTFTGDLLYNIGALSIRNIMEEKAYYRIFTSMFLHADIQHIFSNMIVLYYVGEIVEKRIGHFAYGVIYFLSGIVASVGSMLFEIYTGEMISTVGASGAVFGIEAALLVLVILHRGKLEQMTTGRLLFAIAFSLYCGFTSDHINNAAHVSGVLAGFIITVVVWLLFPSVRKEE